MGRGRRNEKAFSFVDDLDASEDDDAGMFVKAGPTGRRKGGREVEVFIVNPRASAGGRSGGGGGSAAAPRLRAPAAAIMQLRELFPHIEDSVLEAVLADTAGDVHQAAEALLGMMGPHEHASEELPAAAAGADAVPSAACSSSSSAAPARPNSTTAFDTLPTELMLRVCSFLEPSDFIAMGSACRGLRAFIREELFAKKETLTVSGPAARKWRAEKVAAFIGHHTNLSRLSLGNLPLSAKSIAAISMLPAAERIVHLDVSGCGGLTDAALETLTSHMLCLATLDASRTPIGPAGLAAIGSRLEALQRLSLASCPLVTDRAVSQLLWATRSTLTALDVSRCDNLTTAAFAALQETKKAAVGLALQVHGTGRCLQPQAG
eukprot:tig00000042_g15398.t1